MSATIGASALAACAAASEPAPAELARKTQTLQLPFVMNRGQVDERVAFYAPTFGGTVSVTRSGEIVYALPPGPSTRAP